MALLRYFVISLFRYYVLDDCHVLVKIVLYLQRYDILSILPNKISFFLRGKIKRKGECVNRKRKVYQQKREKRLTMSGL